MRAWWLLRRVPQAQPDLSRSRLCAVKGTASDLPVAAALPSLPLKQSSPAGFQRISAIEADGSAGGSVERRLSRSIASGSAVEKKNLTTTRTRNDSNGFPPQELCYVIRSFHKRHTLCVRHTLARPLPTVEPGFQRLGPGAWIHPHVLTTGALVLAVLS